MGGGGPRGARVDPDTSPVKTSGKIDYNLVLFVVVLWAGFSVVGDFIQMVGRLLGLWLVGFFVGVLLGRFVGYMVGFREGFFVG